jgi:hypothetical protein
LRRSIHRRFAYQSSSPAGSPTRTRSAPEADPAGVRCYSMLRTRTAARSRGLRHGAMLLLAGLGAWSVAAIPAVASSPISWSAHRPRARLSKTAVCPRSGVRIRIVSPAALSLGQSTRIRAVLENCSSTTKHFSNLMLTEKTSGLIADSHRWAFHKLALAPHAARVRTVLEDGPAAVPTGIPGTPAIVRIVVTATRSGRVLAKSSRTLRISGATSGLTSPQNPNQVLPADGSCPPEGLMKPAICVDGPASALWGVPETYSITVETSQPEKYARILCAVEPTNTLTARDFSLSAFVPHTETFHTAFTPVTLNLSSPNTGEVAATLIATNSKTVHGHAIYHLARAISLPPPPPPQ